MDSSHSNQFFNFKLILIVIYYRYIFHYSECYSNSDIVTISAILFAAQSSTESISGSEDVVEFTRLLQNYPIKRSKINEVARHSLDDKPNSIDTNCLPELEIQGASPSGQE